MKLSIAGEAVKGTRREEELLEIMHGKSSIGA